MAAISATGRIGFLNVISGVEYVVPYNPISWEPHYDTDEDVVETFDNSETPAIQVHPTDNRIRRMTWNGYPISNSDFMAMVSTLKSYIKTRVILNVKDLDYLGLGGAIIKVVNVIVRFNNANSVGDTSLSVVLEYIHEESAVIPTAYPEEEILIT